MIKSQDIIVLLKLSQLPPDWTFSSLGEELGMSASAVHRSLDRAQTVDLYDSRRRKVDRPALLQFLLHAAKFIFPPKMGGEARGIATAWAAPPLSGQLVSSRKNPPVWPDAKGKVRGISLEPIHTIAVESSRRDPHLREMLTLVDAIRIGGSRERKLAAAELEHRLGSKRGSA